jgi:glucosamine--fructose-6-phosphate aminotransferase (isomerizing)
MHSPSVLRKEIREQPDAVGRLLESEMENVRSVAGELRGRFTYIVAAARGSSDNAARYAKYLFGERNSLQVASATPSLFTMYHAPPDLGNALVIGISQSGQSPDVVSVLAEGLRQERPTVAITNDVDSPLARAAQYVIQLHCGPEESVSASKTYTTSLVALALLSSHLSGDSECLAQIENIPEWMSSTLDGIEPLLDRVERYRYMTQCAVIGRGFNLATAFEIALKIKELTHTVAESYSSAEFRHGPIAMIYEGFPILLVAPGGAVSCDVAALFSALASLHAEQVIITDDARLLDRAHFALPLPGGVPEWLTPLVAVLPGQLFSLALAEAKGLNPDQPKGLTKVTETL